MLILVRVSLRVPCCADPPSPVHHPSCSSFTHDGAQYLGLIALVTNFIGFFAHFFVELPKNAPYDACRSYFRVMPIMQCFASWASHAVFVVRVRVFRCQGSILSRAARRH